jgi:hypothetical protein
MFNDPTNHLALDAAWEMFNLMLQASREFLPGWEIG